MPRKSSVNDEPDSSVTGLSGATASESIENSGSSSTKRSMTGKRRAGSTTSSGASQQNRAGPSEKPAQTTPATGSPTTLTDSKKQRSGLSTFFASLCCMSPKDANYVGDEGPEEAAKTTSKIRAPRTKQATPAAQKHDVSAAESSTADSKEPLDEKTADSAYAANAGTLSDKTGDASAESGPHGSQPMRTPSNKNKSLPKDPPVAIDTSGSTLHPPNDGQPGINLQQPTPVDTPKEADGMIHDRSPEQEQLDNDIEMTNSGVSVPISSDEVPSEGETNDSEKRNSRIIVAPPPPVEQRKKEIASQSPELQPQGQGQKWLLPEIAPRFKGKKCLVLDLDETLVHSSFKVGLAQARTWFVTDHV